MKFVLLASALLLAATGCATSGDVDIDGGSDLDSAAKPDVAPKPDSGPTKPDSGPPQQCVPSCASDTDCQNSCPQVPNGLNCCDTSTGICYQYADTTCPAPVVSDAGLD